MNLDISWQADMTSLFLFSFNFHSDSSYGPIHVDLSLFTIVKSKSRKPIHVILKHKIKMTKMTLLIL